MNESVLSPLLKTNIKLLLGPGAGYDTFDIPYLTAHGIVYANSPVFVARMTADATILMTLQARSPLPCVSRLDTSSTKPRGTGVWRLTRHSSSDAISLFHLDRPSARRRVRSSPSAPAAGRPAWARTRRASRSGSSAWAASARG